MDNYVQPTPYHYLERKYIKVLVFKKLLVQL